MTLTEKLAKLREQNSDRLTEWQEFHPFINQDELVALIDVAEAAAERIALDLPNDHRNITLHTRLDRLEELL